MSRSRKPRHTTGLPPSLVRIIAAADHTHRNNDEADRAGHAAALTKLGRLAMSTVPAHGVLAPTDDHVYKAIDKIAGDDLGLGEAQAVLETALKQIDARHAEAVASAVTDVLHVSDTAYNYAGLTSGLTWAER